MIFVLTLAAVLHTPFARGDDTESQEPSSPASPAAPGKAPYIPRPQLIFDTDMGNDIDDALALSVIHSLQGRRECDLLAVTVSKDNPLAARFCDIVNTYYGHTGKDRIPIGRVRDGKTPEDGQFLPGVVFAKHGPHPRYRSTFTGEDDTPDATEMLREVLAAQGDKTVTLVVVGFSTNIARLLESKPDKHSPLDGRALVEQKVALLSMMAGYFGTGQPADFKEYNIHIDLPASTAVFENWPTPIVVSGFEIGLAIPYSATSIEHDFEYDKHHPVKKGYEHYMQMPYDRPTWDLTSVLYAVRPGHNYFGLSEPGEIHVVDGGITSFKPGGHGRHRYLTVSPEQITRVKEALTLLATEPPRRIVYLYTTVENSGPSKNAPKKK